MSLGSVFQYFVGYRFAYISDFHRDDHIQNRWSFLAIESYNFTITSVLLKKNIIIFQLPSMAIELRFHSIQSLFAEDQ